MTVDPYEPWPDHETDRERYVALDRFWECQFEPKRELPALPEMSPEQVWPLLRTMLVRCGYLDMDSPLSSSRHRPKPEHIKDLLDHFEQLPEPYRPVFEQIEHYWPAFESVAGYEFQLIDKAAKSLLSGPLLAVQELTRDGVPLEHANWLLGIARRYLQEAYTDTPENQRSLALFRLDDLMRRAREACDLRTELGGLKTAAVVSGLTRTPPQDESFEIAEIVREVSGSTGELPAPEDEDPGDLDF